MRKYLECVNVRQGFFLALVFSLTITLAGLNVRELESGDETRVAGIAAEMFVSGDYLIPRLNGTPFLEYPPLYYWSGALSYSIFGISDFAAKLPAALAAAGCGLLVFLFALKLKFPAWCALLSCILLMTSAQFFGNSRKCMVDMMLAFFILLAVFSFYALAVAARRRNRIGYFILFAVALAGGIGTKGLLGFCIPVAVSGCWLATGDWLERKFSLPLYGYLGFGSAAALGIAAVWYAEVYVQGGREMFNTVFYENNFGRFSGSQGDHVESFFYYFIKLPTLFFPWLLILFPAIWEGVRRVRKEHDRGILLLLIFLLVPFAALCLGSSKRTVYLLPLYAPCALLCGSFLMLPPLWLRKASAPFIPSCFRLFRPGIVRFGIGCAVLAAVFALGETLYGFHTNSRESLRPLFAECAALERAGNKVVLMAAPERTRGAAFFYLHHRLEEIAGRDGAPPEGEFRVTRAKKIDLPGRAYADHHKLIGKELL